VADLSIVFEFDWQGTSADVVTFSGSGLMPESVVKLDIYFVDGTSILGRVLHGVADANGDFAANSSFLCADFTSVTLNGHCSVRNADKRVGRIALLADHGVRPSRSTVRKGLRSHRRSAATASHGNGS